MVLELTPTIIFKINKKKENLTMSYNITEFEEDITISKENLKPMLKALTKFANNKLKNKPYYINLLPKNTKITDQNSANLYFGRDPANTDNLLTILQNMMFDPDFDNAGNLVALNYVGENLYDELNEFFDVIAPFVEPDSYASFEGESQDFFQYAFDGKTMHEKIGKIVWTD